MNRQARRSWSIAERATVWFAATTGTVVLGIAGYATWEVRHSKDNEIDALATERMAELRTRFDPAEELESASHAGEVFRQRRAEFTRLVDAISRQSGDNPLGVRVIDATTGESLGDFGQVRLIPTELPVREEPQRLPGDRFAHSDRLVSDIHVVMVIDGRHQYDEWRHFALTAFALAIVAGFGAYFSGRFFIQRACEYMSALAKRTREVRYSTEQVRIEPGSVPEEIAELVRALEHMLSNIRVEEERTRLLARGLAHELGSPLQNLIGETEVALMAKQDPAEYRRVLESHLEELRDIGHAIGNLMTLVSQRRGEGGTASERFDLGVEIELRLARERAHALRNGIALDVRISGDLSISGDREALWLVVSNLVANAIDYTPRGGQVRLELCDQGERVRIVVDDSGPGIPPEERELVFEPFRRGATREGRRAGYGLGLSIVRSAVEAQGGTVRIDTSHLGGARFTVELPRERA